MEEASKNNVCENEIYQNLFRTLAKPVRNFLVYKGSETEQANDIVQETFIKLWENCKKVSIGSAKSYIYTLAGNAFKNEMAHLKVKLKYAQSNAYDDTTIETPEFKMEENEFRDKLNDAIASLTPAQREVFLMSKIEKKKYAEIAELLDISVKAVEKRMHGALKSLRAEIKFL